MKSKKNYNIKCEPAQPDVVGKPVRDIPIQTRSVSGIMPQGWRYESSLERDFMVSMSFEPDFEDLVPQPLTLSYSDRSGQQRRYTPDALVKFQADPPLGQAPRNPWLCEVKYRADCRSLWRKLLPKYRAAKMFAQERGWEFHIFTELELRGPYLENLYFLRMFLRRCDDRYLAHAILDKIWDLQITDPHALLHIMFQHPDNRAAALPIIWFLVATRRVGAKLHEPLTMFTPIWHLEGMNEPL
ncbi:MAG: TnsA endonuclease N-terminal domain-containing protein [Pseudomonadota bacterium]